MLFCLQPRSKYWKCTAIHNAVKYDEHVIYTDLSLSYTELSCKLSKVVFEWFV